MSNSSKPGLLTRIRLYFSTNNGIHTNLWLSYFIFWGGAAAIMPYINVYYESVNLKGTQIGLLTSIPFFISMISSIFFAFVSDVSKQHRTVLRLCATGLIGVMALYPTADSFTAFLPIVLLSSIINAPFNAIMDETTLSSLSNPANYGKIRVGGSIGWGLMVLFTGLIIDKIGKGLVVIFYINIVFLFIYLINTIFMPETKKKINESRKKLNFKSVLDMLRLPGFIPFLLMIIIWGMGESSISNFLFLHIKSLGGSSTLMGTALSISLTGEIVTFSIADKLQSRIGPQKMMLLAFLVLFTWLTGLSLIRDPNMIPFFQIFGGAGFALIQSGSVAYVNARAPKELGTTAQAIRGGIFSGFGVGLGALISGVLYERSGSIILFRNMSFLVIAGFIIGFFLYLSKQRKNNSFTN